jgi:hypothetical protein
VTTSTGVVRVVYPFEPSYAYIKVDDAVYALPLQSDEGFGQYRD